MDVAALWESDSIAVVCDVDLNQLRGCTEVGNFEFYLEFLDYLVDKLWAEFKYCDIVDIDSDLNGLVGVNENTKVKTGRLKAFRDERTGQLAIPLLGRLLQSV